MPIYEYICKKCNNVFSFLQKSGSSEKDISCDKCGSKDIKKKFSSFSCLSSKSSLFSSSSTSGGSGS
ncbi:MAG: zinc ribbon domain-containing protein [Nitrospirota bacterium]|nr:zinc ribbon domain-containing protein [Nitrospirota bacterium]MDH5767549.1 zinc ribbon domain-containing protein [Nitrospirota bacterium]